MPRQPRRDAHPENRALALNGLARIVNRNEPSGRQQMMETTIILVGPAGIEPATLGLEIRCSIRLSYGPVRGLVHFITGSFPSGKRSTRQALRTTSKRTTNYRYEFRRASAKTVQRVDPIVADWRIDATRDERREADGGNLIYLAAARESPTTSMRANSATRRLPTLLST